MSIQTDVFVLENIKTGELLTNKKGVVIHHHDYKTMARLRLINEIFHCTVFNVKTIRKALIHATS